MFPKGLRSYIRSCQRPTSIIFPRIVSNMQLRAEASTYVAWSDKKIQLRPIPYKRVPTLGDPFIGLNSNLGGPGGVLSSSLHSNHSLPPSHKCQRHTIPSPVHGKLHPSSGVWPQLGETSTPLGGFPNRPLTNPQRAVSDFQGPG